MNNAPSIDQLIDYIDHAPTPPIARVRNQSRATGPLIVIRSLKGGRQRRVVTLGGVGGVVVTDRLLTQGLQIKGANDRYRDARTVLAEARP